MAIIKMEPLQEWVCDSCGELVDIKDGWFEWVTDQNTGLASGFRIVHNSRNCFYDSMQLHHQGKSNHDMHIDSYLGASGLVKLLAIAERGNIEDISEWTEIVRRLHIPYYEEAKIHWGSAERDGYFDGANEYWSYLPDVCKRLIERYGDDE